jgi:Putative zinc-finger
MAGECRKKLFGALRQIRVLWQVFALIRSRMAPIDRYTCEETIRRLDDYLDRELTPHEMQLVKEHLAAPADLMAKVSRALQQAQGKESSQ